jgi:hypothetical protein
MEPCTFEVYELAIRMDVTFRSAELARLCNSERQLVRRWGAQLGSYIARRLCDLAAVDASALHRLPETRVETAASGQTQLSFGDFVVIQGVLTPGLAARPGAGSADGGGILITSVNVEGTEVR